MPLLTDALLPAFTDILTSLLPVVEMLITSLLPPLLSIFTALIPPISELITTLIPPLVSILTALMPVVETLITSLLPPLVSLFTALTPLISALTPVIAEVADIFSDYLSAAIENVIGVIESVISIFESVISFLTNVFKGDWEGAWNDIIDIFKGIFNLIPTIIETILNNGIAEINALISGINSIADKVGISVSLGTIDNITLPKFHTGGIIDFEGKYEAPILAKNGEMVLTDIQQKRLFDIANGLYTPNMQTSGDISTHKTDVKIEHKNYFTVRNDNDIDRISEELSRKETKDILSLGGE